MAQINNVRPIGNSEYRVYWESMVDSGFFDVWAKDELDAYNQAKERVEERNMTERWVFTSLIALAAIIVMAIASCSTVQTQIEEESRLSRIEKCLATGQSYAANKFGYVCGKSPRFPSADPTERSGTESLN